MTENEKSTADAARAAAKAAAAKAAKAAKPAGPTGAAPSEPVAAAQPAAPAQPQAPAAPSQPAPMQATPAASDSSVKNTAIIALIMAFVFPLVGVILGHIQLNSIKRTGVGANSKGMLQAALILSYVFMGLALLAIIAIVAFFSYMASVNPYMYD